MYKKVVQKAFEKADTDIPGKTSKTSISEYISLALLNDFKMQISGKTLRNLLDESYKIEQDEDIKISSEYVQALCKYLGFLNYDDYLSKNSKPSTPQNLFISFFTKNWLVLIICIFSISFIIGYSILNKQKWMAWDNNQFVEVDFDEEKFNLNQLKVFNEEQLIQFKKIEPDCSTKFFNEDGSELLWYGKNAKGELEYFSLFGKHPITGKTLKPITTYMIRKHICDSY